MTAIGSTTWCTNIRAIRNETGADRVALGLFCAGCFQSDAALYAGVKPLQPFHAGPRHQPRQGWQDTAMISDAGRGRGLSADRPKSRPQAPAISFFCVSFRWPGRRQICWWPKCAIAATRASNNVPGARASTMNWSRILPDRVEWRDPDCSKTFSQTCRRGGDNRFLQVRRSRVLGKGAARGRRMPWQADGAYLLH